MIKISSLIAVFTLTLTSFAHAGPISVDAGWYGFCFAEVGSPATPGCQAQGVGTTGNSITFTTTADSFLMVTDAFGVGDIFDVFINNTFAFTTSAPGTGADIFAPGLAFDSGYYSHGSLLLAAGSYEVDIFATASPFGAGAGYVQVASAVPEPAGLLMLATGLLGLGFARKKKSA